MKIPAYVIDDIRARTDIAELIGGSLPLRRAGRSLVACCPFHNEKTPSFNVIPHRGIFHCFGCGEGGDAIDWIRKAHGASFREAVVELAARAGILLEGESTAAPRKPLAPVVVRPPPPVAPPPPDLDAFWHRCLPCPPDDPFLRERGLLGLPKHLARFTPPADSGAFPTWWPAGRAKTWRLVTRGFNAAGEPVNLHARAVVDPPEFEGRKIKTLWAKGGCGCATPCKDPTACPTYREISASGVVFWNQVRPAGAELVVIAEGIPDFLTAALWAEKRGVAVYGVTSGSCSAFHDIEVPVTVPIIIATHEDSAGERYADEVRNAYVGHPLVSRSRSTFVAARLSSVAA